jgi:hypothetical protein
VTCELSSEDVNNVSHICQLHYYFFLKIKVTYLDGKPVTDGKVEIEVSRSRFYYRGTRQLFRKTYSFKNGIVAGVVEDMPQDTEKLHFKVS